MRKNVKSLAPTLWFVIAAFIISIFAVWGGAGRLGESRGANVLATVGKEKISSELYFQTLRQRLEIMKREFKDLDQNFIQQLNIPQQILEQLVQQSLLLQAAQKMKIQVSDEEIREKIMAYPVFQKDNQFVGFEEYKRILDWNRIPVSDFEESLEKEILIEKVIKTLTTGIAVTEEEVRENYKKNNESAKLEYAVYDADKITLEEESPVQEIREFFEKNKDSFKIPERREASYVFISFDEMEKEIEIDDSQVENYYRENLARFSEPETTKVSRIFLPYGSKDRKLVLSEAQYLYDRIDKGEDFGNLAKSHSKDEKAEDYGNWGTFEWKRLSPSEQEEIGKLSEGQISSPVELEDGVSLLKVTEKKPPIQKTLDEVKERIIDTLKDQNVRILAEKKISQLEKRAEKEKSLDTAAQKEGLKIHSTGLVKESQAIDEIDPSGSLSLSLFKLQEKEFTSPVYTYKGVVLAQLNKIDPPRPALFEEVQEEVRKKFKEQAKKKRAIDKITRIRTELDEKDLETLALSNDLEYKTVEEHKRGQYLSIVGENPEIDRLAFSLPLGEASEPVEFEGVYVLMRVLDRKEVTPEEFEKNKKEETENYLESKRMELFQSVLLNLRENAGVKINYDLFLKINSDVLSRFSGEN